MRNDEVDFMIAGSNEESRERGKFVSMLYNGKIDRCGVVKRVLSEGELHEVKLGNLPADPLTYWDTAEGYTDRGIGQKVIDIGPNGLTG